MDINNMVMDFGKIKEALRKFASELDHMVLVPTENPDIGIDIREDEGYVNVDMTGKIYRFPLTDVKFIPIPTTTVEEMSKHLLSRLLNDLTFPENIERVELGMDEGVGQGAWASVDIGGKEE
jgi:6-pyruvoyltetrahydropterin/6-carboxytetrahydropterin synthase